MKAIVGQAYNLPWWKICCMSDEQVKQHNSKFLQEIEMKDDNLSDTQQQVCGYCGGQLPCLTHSVGIKKEFSPNKETNVYAIKIWNEAIEAAANLFLKDDDRICDDIRKLKK